MHLYGGVKYGILVTKGKNKTMKKLLVFLFFVLSVAGAYATEPAANTVAGVGYVKTAYDDINVNKIGTTISSTGTGNVVTGVTVTTNSEQNPTETTGIQLTKSNIQIPNGSASGNTYSSIWVD